MTMKRDCCLPNSYPDGGLGFLVCLQVTLSSPGQARMAHPSYAVSPQSALFPLALRILTLASRFLPSLSSTRSSWHQFPDVPFSCSDCHAPLPTSIWGSRIFPVCLSGPLSCSCTCCCGLTSGVRPSTARHASSSSRCWSLLPRRC